VWTHLCEGNGPGLEDTHTCDDDCNSESHECTLHLLFRTGGGFSVLLGLFSGVVMTGTALLFIERRSKPLTCSTLSVSSCPTLETLISTAEKSQKILNILDIFT